MGSNPATNPRRVFVDSSVLFAAALSPTGFARDLIVAGIQGRLDLFVSTLVFQETRRNLTAKVPHALTFFHSFESSGVAQIGDPPVSLVLQVAQVVAGKDAPIVAGAISARATFLATYDRKHLLRQAALIQAN
jgi:predicted nucleic acid-binding protein